MDRYQCFTCNYVYDPQKGDPESGIEPGRPFKELPDHWGCPECGAAKETFNRIEE